MIRITFADGSHEDRDDASPCLCGMFDPPSRHPSEERWYLYCPGDRQPLSFCGISVWSLATVRGWTASVWRITSVKGEPLAGEWAECHVESFEEQIARLTAERDAAEKRLADLRAWAENIANGQSDSPEGRRVAGDFRAVVYRIDGEDD